MGSHTDMMIRQWQEHAGLEPAPEGQRRAILEQMAQHAARLIEIIALEKAGIRDGAGWWYGCDPLGETIYMLGKLEAEYHATPVDAPRKSLEPPDGPVF